MATHGDFDTLISEDKSSVCWGEIGLRKIEKRPSVNLFPSSVSLPAQKAHPNRLDRIHPKSIVWRHENGAGSTVTAFQDGIHTIGTTSGDGDVGRTKAWSDGGR